MLEDDDVSVDFHGPRSAMRRGVRPQGRRPRGGALDQEDGGAAGGAGGGVGSSAPVGGDGDAGDDGEGEAKAKRGEGSNSFQSAMATPVEYYEQE